MRTAGAHWATAYGEGVSPQVRMRGARDLAGTWPWDRLTPAEAIRLQLSLRERVETQDRLPAAIRYVGGVDVGYVPGKRLSRAAVVVLRFPQLEPVDYAVAYLPTCFPYVPGLLSFRELPAVLAAMQRLRITPDLWLCDGQGLAHPRRFGIACHLGVLVDAPCIGVAKSRLVGSHTEPPAAKGGWVPLIDAGEVVGAVVRTRSGVRPVYVSIGHRICLQTAIALVLACTPRFRLPETTRWAHRLASGQEQPDRSWLRPGRPATGA